MRRWTVFVAALTILSLLLPGYPVLAKSSKTQKKSVVSARSSPQSSSQKKGVASRVKTAVKQEKKAGPKLHAGKTSGKAARGASHRAAQAQEKNARRVLEKAIPAAKASLPDSYKGDFGVSTKAAMVMDTETSRVLFAQEADMPIAPASLTKVLTLYLVYEKLKSGSLKPEQAIPVPSDAAHIGGSNMRLHSGETVILDELIKGIAIASANDGCVAIAEYLGNGDAGLFVQAMNAKAKELGMTSSYFVNPNGLPAEGQVTTARDMAILAQAYLKRFPETLAVHSMTEFTHNNRVRHNSNTLLGRVEGVDGLKTGFVCASGYNIVVTAKRGGTRLVAVVLGAKNRRVREREATRLVEEGFKIVAAEKIQSGKQMAMAH